MNVFVLSMAGLAAAALAVLIYILLPGVTDLSGEQSGLLALGMLVIAMAAAFLNAFGRYARRLERLESAHATLFEELNKLRLRQGSEPASPTTEDGGNSREMLEEIRMLQTLLSQIVARGGLGRLPEQFGHEAEPDAAGDATEPATAEPSGAPEPTPLDEAAITDIMRGALSSNRVDLYLQPIVTLPSRRNSHYECFSRVRDESDRVIYPSDYMPVAESAGLSGTLDNILLFRCIQLVRKLGPRKPDAMFFCNIASSSVHDADFFPQFVDYMLQNRSLSDRLVFEFAFRDFLGMAPDLLRQLRALGRGGYRLSIDHVESLRFDPGDLADKHVRFVKVDADLLLSGGDGDIHAADLASQLRRAEMRLIASKVEDEAQMPELLDMDIGLAQGYLFGEPRPSRDLPSGAPDSAPD